MMAAKIFLVSGIAAAICLIAATGCRSLEETPSDELLHNPSVHIMVSNEQTIPSTGTFDFDTKLFKINYSEDIDLAAIDTRIVRALQAELELKGLRRVTESPDLSISYAVAVDSSITSAEFNEAYSKDFPIELPDPAAHETLEYHHGTLIVDFVDNESRKLLWRGAIMAGLDVTVTEAEKDRRVRLAAKILLDHFPKPIEASDRAGLK